MNKINEFNYDSYLASKIFLIFSVLDTNNRHISHLRGKSVDEFEVFSTTFETNQDKVSPKGIHKSDTNPDKTENRLSISRICKPQEINYYSDKNISQIICSH